MSRRIDTALQLLGPAALVVAVGVFSTTVSRALEIYFLNALVSTQ